VLNATTRSAANARSVRSLLSCKSPLVMATIMSRPCPSSKRASDDEPSDRP
jgi:hypothetical protein